MEAITLCALRPLFSSPNKPGRPSLSPSSCTMEGPGTPLALLGWPSSEGIVTIGVTMIALVLSLGLMLVSVQTWLFCSFWCQICYKLKLFYIEILAAYPRVSIRPRQNLCGLKDHCDSSMKPNKHFPTKKWGSSNFLKNYETRQLLRRQVIWGSVDYFHAMPIHWEVPFLNSWLTQSLV